ncbi:imm11 family protein [Flavisolibacter ginsenosidimutans]|uniref:Immunity MXAN-0049 protein domain-containing protein n=1 Tax=Flavisolibacter ginsenosidimutans TaxID=661481 RepID=A0A5B8UKV5_9BACT|nr:DUF1629 domain-containing protein [Flavisolibacter ginsenosidimutans]QEC56819.1 hypothetical protein FSB75_13230 [Flavisolibacter ginsenosidimutans]
MANEFEYYRIHRKNDKDVPLLDEDTNCPTYLSLKAPVENPEMLLFRLGKPVPKKPIMADYHSTPKSVISKKIFDVLNPFNISGIQLLPSKIRGKNDEIFTDYWAIHIYHILKCVDVEQSNCSITFMLSNIKKIVLDRNILKLIPLRERLVFRLKEDPAFQLFHVSVVDSIMATNPTGIAFTNIEAWTDRTLFQN